MKSTFFVLLSSLISLATIAADPFMSPVHQGGSVVFEGPYVPAQTVLDDMRPKLSLARFGTSEIVLPTQLGGGGFVVREAHYLLESNELGVRIIPVVDRPTEGAALDPNYPLNSSGQTANNSPVVGSEILDGLINQMSGVTTKDKDPAIFAVIAYTHPENHVTPFEEIGNPEALKLEMGFTHMGAYIGQGQTRNSPLNYHKQKWNVKGYPNVTALVGLEGVSQKIFNLNAYITMRLLNEADGGVDFPSDYKFDYYHAVNMEETLAHFRAWVDPTWVRTDIDATKPYLQVLKNNEFFKTYCAEHITIVLNVALNLPQNLRGYQEMFGENVGADLWEKAKQTWAGITNGGTIPEVPSFKPLWQRNDVNGKPYYKITRFKDGHTSSTAVIGRRVGKSMIWAPATNIDLIANFVEMYASWKFIGPVLTSVTLVSLAPEMQDRMGMQAEAFLELALPIIAKMFVYDLLAKPVDQVDATLARNLGMLEMLLKGKVPQEAFESLKVWIGEEMRQKEEQLRAVGAIRNIDIAYGLFKDDLSKEIEGIRNMEVVNPFLASYRASCDSSTNCNLAKNVKFYSPPATLHRTLMGLHPRNPHVTVKVVGTVMDASDVDFKEGVKKTVCDLKNLSCQEIR